MLNKKALSMIMIVGIMISAITLIILFFYINSIFDNYQYSQSLIACNLLFSNIDGKTTYFGTGLDKINTKLIDEIAKQCSSKKVIIDDKSINVAADLVLDCFKKTGSGEDIFGSFVKDQKLCLYCGEIEAKEDILDFRNKLNKELSKEKYNSSLYSKDAGIENMNQFNLQLTPNSLKKGESTTLFYYIYRSELPKDASVSTFIQDQYMSSIFKMVADTSNIGTLITYFSSSTVLKTYGGVILTKSFENKNKEDFERFKNSINLQDDCTVIIPLKNYN